MKNPLKAAAAPPPRSPEREALAAAVARHTAATAEIDAINQAIEANRSRSSDARRATTASVAALEEARASATQYLVDEALGTAVARPLPVKAAIAAHHEAAEAEQTLDDARAALDVVLAAAEGELHWAAAQLKRAVQAVIGSSPQLAQLFERHAALWREELELGAVLSGLTEHMLSGLFNNNMRRPLYDTNPPLLAAWQEAASALARDPDAALPRESGR